MEVRPTPLYPQGMRITEPAFNPGMLMESCLFKPVTSALMGGALGLGAGILFGSYEAITPPMDVPGQPAPPGRGLRQEVVVSLKRTTVKARNWGKNFAMVTAVFSGVECAIEKTRGKKDIFNGVSAGCVTGAALAAKAGPEAMCFGCAGFAAFSALMEYIMH